LNSDDTRMAVSTLSANGDSSTTNYDMMSVKNVCDFCLLQNSDSYIFR